MILPEKEQNKLRVLYKKQEQLRLEHNEAGRQFREGEFTEEEWLNYKDLWSKKHSQNCQAIGVVRFNLINTSIIYPIQEADHRKKEFNREIIYPEQLNTDEKQFHYLLLLRKKIEKIYEDSDDPMLEEDVRGADLLQNVEQELGRLKGIFRYGV